MKNTRYGKILEAGDIVEYNGIRVVIKKILLQEYYNNDNGFNIEFIDTNGNHHNWKQNIDGGHVISTKGGDRNA